jgi:hypothetical protein
MNTNNFLSRISHSPIPHLAIVTLLYLAALTFLASFGLAESAPKPELTKLETRLSCIDLDDPKLGSNQSKEYRIYLEIRNVGKAVAVLPTKGIGPAVLSDGFVIFNDSKNSLRDGTPIVSPPAEFAIVDLRPGEAVILSYTLRKDERPASRGQVTVRYIITKEFAERYGTWSGELDAGVVKFTASKQDQNGK